MIVLPKASGRQSARRPGSPANDATRCSSGNETGPRRESGRWTGEISSPDSRKASSYSNTMFPCASSATAPTCRPQRRIRATVKAGSARRRSATRGPGPALVGTRPPTWRACPLSLVAAELGELEGRHERHRQAGVERVEAPERPQQPHEGLERRTLSRLRAHGRADTYPGGRGHIGQGP